MNKTVYQALLDRVLFIGNTIGEDLAQDDRDKFILLGVPQDFIDETGEARFVRRDEIAGAVARGWCHPDNEHKVMDEELAWAIVDEIQAILYPTEEGGDADE